MSRASRLHLKNKRKIENYILDKVVLAIAFIEPLTTTGQIYQIYKNKDATGNSLVTWTFFALSAVIWLIYSIKLKNKPLIISSLLWLITESVVVFEIVHYS